VLMSPHLVLSATGRTSSTTISPSVWRQVMQPDVAAEITTAMEQAVNGTWGRLFTTGARVSGLTVAGKSGTAELDPGLNPHSWFIAFAPGDNPQVAIAVIVEHGAHEVRASPLAGDLFRAWQAWANS